MTSLKVHAGWASVRLGRSAAEIDAIAASLRYADLSPLLGVAGIALAYDDNGSEAMHAVLARPLDKGTVAGFAWSGAFAGDPDALLRSFRMADAMGAGPPERESLVQAFPGPDGDGGWGLPLGLERGMLPAQREALARLASRHRELAREAVRTLPMPDDMRSAAHAFLDVGVPPPDRRLTALRRDEGEAFWGLHEMAATHGQVYACVMEQVEAAVLEGIDLQGLTAAEAIAEAYPGITPAHVRRLRGVAAGEFLGIRPGTDEGFGAEPTGIAATAMAVLLPVDWFPEPAGRRAFGTLSAMAVGLEARLGLDAVNLLRPVAGRWAEACASVGSEMGVRHPHGGDAAAFVCDAVGHAAAGLFLPVLAAGDPGTAADCAPAVDAAAHALAVEATLRGAGIVEVARRAGRWHGLRDAVMAAAGPRDTAWAPVLDDVDLPGGLRVACLADAASLAEEGAAGPDRNGVAGLDHCVATLAHRYVTGQAHVLSVRRILPDGGYERLSTAEVEVGGEGTLAVLQHRGLANSDPPSEAADALDAFLGMVDDGTLEMNEVPRPPPGGDWVAERCGFDWRDPGVLAAVVAAWQPLLPRALRGLDPAGLREAALAIRGDGPGAGLGCGRP